MRPAPLATLRGHDAAITALTFFSASSNSRPVSTIVHQHESNSFASSDSPKPLFLASGDANGAFRVWHLPTRLQLSDNSSAHPQRPGNPVGGLIAIEHLVSFRWGEAEEEGSSEALLDVSGSVFDEFGCLLLTQGRDGRIVLWLCKLESRAGLARAPQMLWEFAADCITFCKMTSVCYTLVDSSTSDSDSPSTRYIVAFPDGDALGVIEVHVPSFSSLEANSTSCAVPEPSVLLSNVLDVLPPGVDPVHATGSGKRLGMCMAIQLVVSGDQSLFLVAAFENSSIHCWELDGSRRRSHSGGANDPLGGQPDNTAGLSARYFGGIDNVLAMEAVTSFDVVVDDERRCFRCVAVGPTNTIVVVEIFSIDDNHISSIRRKVSVEGESRQGFSDVSLRQDRKLLALAGWDHRTRILSFPKLKNLATLREHRDGIAVVSFAAPPHLGFLAVGSKDQRITLWELYAPSDAERTAPVEARNL